MSTKEFTISSHWEWERGTWDNKLNKFYNRHIVKAEEKQLKVIVKNNILHFIGGPTGFESYNLNDLKGNKYKNKDFCICGGTINSWPRCVVPSKEVKAIIDSVLID